MLRQITKIATVCLATVAATNQYLNSNQTIANASAEINQVSMDPYTKYNSLHPIPAVDIEE
jgi:hypothetical protein